MPPKNKAQLKAEIEEAKRELQEYRAGTEEQIRVLQNSEADFHSELEGLRERIREFERGRTENAGHLEDAQAEIRELRAALERSRSRSSSRSPLRSGGHTSEDAPEVSPTVREIMLAKEEALQAIDHSHWELDKMKREIQQSLQEVAEGLRADTAAKLKEQFGASNSKGEGSTLGGGSCEQTTNSDTASPCSESGAPHVEEASSVSHVEKPMRLPPLTAFDGNSTEDVDALGRWLSKLDKHAELMHWSERTKFLRFELHLAGRAERVYELLPDTVKGDLAKASRALCERLYPVESEALISRPADAP